LFEFNVGGVTITPPDEDDFNPAEGAFKKLFKSPKFMKMLEKQDFSEGSVDLDANKLNEIMKNAEKNKPKNNFNVNTRIGELIKSEGQEVAYIYDFGDN